MSDRGMKKYLPFSSLIEQASFLDEMIYEKNKTEKPQISIEQAKKINSILTHYNNIDLKIEFYMNGYLYTYNGKIDKIDTNNKTIYIKDFIIPIKNIIDIESPDIFDEIC